MYFYPTNHTIIATYGVGSGNAPALSFDSVGHLRVASLNFLKVKSYEHHLKQCRTHGKVC